MGDTIETFEARLSGGAGSKPGAARWAATVVALLVATTLQGLVGCRRAPEPALPAAGPPWLLLVTLDTTRADVAGWTVGPLAEASGELVMPRLAAFAATGVRFTQAYATAPTTLPSHTSMMSGLYPAGHGIHENGRRVGDGVPLLAERLGELGYATAAFVSGFPLQRQFGLARGFEVYDDELPDGRERSAAATTSRALAHLAAASQSRPLFLWVHYYDPHEPYEPPEPFRSRFADDPYRGEVAAMDHELGRLLDAFAAASSGTQRVLITADHGEGRGDHGEALHGNLLYQGVMWVPMVVGGDGVAPGEQRRTVSVRQVRATFLDWAKAPADEAAGSLLGEPDPAGGPVMGEAMTPFLNYRWQPQVMAVAEGQKLIRAGRLELYDVFADPAEGDDLVARGQTPNRALARAVVDYPLPAPGVSSNTELPNEETRRKLASLGYLSSTESAPVVVPENAPRPADMTGLFADLDLGSRLFGEAQYASALPLLESLLVRDPGNLMVAVRLGVAASLGGAGRSSDQVALAAFERALEIDPESVEARHYLAMHHLEAGRGAVAAPLFEVVLAAQPDRLPALVGLAEIRARQGRAVDAAALLDRAVPLARDPGPLFGKLGVLRMELGETAAALDAFERARASATNAGGAGGFAYDLELGVLYLAARRFDEARDALDRVAPSHPGFAMALFKRAQVSVLLQEPDREQRVHAAAAGADRGTRELIANERLFVGLLP